MPAKHQHVPYLFWSFTDVVGRLITSVKINVFVESVVAESAGSAAVEPSDTAPSSNAIGNFMSIKYFVAGLCQGFADFFYMFFVAGFEFDADCAAVDCRRCIDTFVGD